MFNVDGDFIGWFEADNSLWGIDGVYIGERVEKDYVLRSSNIISPINKLPKVPPIPPIPPIPPMPRISKIPKVGWSDPFED